MATTTDKKTTKAAPKATAKSVKAPKAEAKTTAKSAKPAAKAVKTSKADVNSFAVIQIGGVQLKVEEGKLYEVEKLEGDKGDSFDVTEVLMYSKDDTVTLGKPFIDGAKVSLRIDSQKKGEKIDGFKYKAKSRYHKRYGHRALITRVEVQKISV